MGIIHSLTRLIRGKDPAEKEMEYLLAHGLRIGKNFKSFRFKVKVFNVESGFFFVVVI